MPKKTALRSSVRNALFLRPAEGRTYSMGPISAIFKADGCETRNQYSVSEWWLEPYTRGPGAHSHAEDDVFFVIEGVMSFFVDGEWSDAPMGSFVLIPGGARHDFENRSPARAGALNFSVPGNFEQHMPDIARWLARHPPGRTA